MGDALERVRAAEIARITGLSVRKVQEHAAAGQMPGAAKLGGIWTFDPVKVRAWVAAQEVKAWRGSQATSIGGVRGSGGARSSAGSNIDAAYLFPTRPP